MLDKRIINTAVAGVTPSACTTDTVQILDGVPLESVATYQLDGNANDLTTNYNGTWSGTEAYTTGQFGQAAVFDGSSSYISLTQPVNLSTDDFTYSFWINPATNTGYGAPLAQYGGINATRNFYSYRMGSTEKITFGLVSTGGAFNQIISTGTTPLNQWTHVALVRDSSTQKIYLNGQLSGSLSNTTTTSTSSEPFLIGSTNENVAEFFNGSIDQVRIFNTALSADNVATLYNETVATASNTYINLPSLVAYYKMSDATDETGSYDGTPTNVNFNVAGKFGNAGEFNGSSSDIQLPDGTTGTGALTISMWVKVNNVAGTAKSLFQFGPDAGTNVESFISSNTLFFRLTVGGATDYFLNDGGSKVLEDTWTHVVFVHPNTTTVNAAKLFVNGIEVAQGTQTAAVTRPTTGQFIGQRQTNSLHFDGSIDQVRIFNRAITEEEVETLYNEVQCVPDIVPTDYFNTVLYTGNSTNDQSVTEVGFQPDFVWIKSKNTGTGTSYHGLWDSVRGTGGHLYSSLINAETNTPNRLYSFDLDGFSLGNGVDPEYIGNNNYVAWNWKAAGAPTATNSAGAGNVPTAGSVKIDGADSTTALAGTIAAKSISANTDAGFSIVKYTGNNTAGATVGHGLYSPPELIIYKRTDVAANWIIKSSILGVDNYLIFTTDQSFPDSGVFWNSTLPNSSVFTLGNSASVNVGNYIAYCFHSVDGYSKIGSYVGNRPSTNTIVTGFRPAFVMIKDSTNSGEDWIIVDNKREGASAPTKVLYPNTSGLEDSYTVINFTSNGFTVGDTGLANTSGATIIYLAIAEEVFVPDNFFNDDSTVATYKLDGDAGDDSGNGYNGIDSNVTYAAGEFDLAGVIGAGKVGNSATQSSILTNYFEVNVGSISLWVRRNGNSIEQEYLTNTVGGFSDLGTAILINGSQLRVYVNGTAINTSGLNIGDGNWHHIALTWNLPAGGTNVTLYVDNVPVNTASVGVGGWTGNSRTALRLGHYTFTNTNNGFSGSIDQVRIFNRALDAGEVTQLYNE